MYWLIFTPKGPSRCHYMKYIGQGSEEMDGIGEEMEAVRRFFLSVGNTFYIGSYV